MSNDNKVVVMNQNKQVAIGKTDLATLKSGIVLLACMHNSQASHAPIICLGKNSNSLVYLFGKNRFRLMQGHGCVMLKHAVNYI